MRRYINGKNLLAIAGARSFEELAVIALQVLRDMPQPVAMIHGPLTTGGTSPEENWMRLRTEIFSSREKNPGVFNQMPFLKMARRIASKKAPPARRALSFFLFWRKEKENAINRREFREKFHRPLIQSGLIPEMFFMEGWEDSEEARWYHDQAEKSGIRITYLPSPVPEETQEM